MTYEVRFLEGVPFEVDKEKYNYEVMSRTSTIVVKTIDDKGEDREQRFGFVDKEEIYLFIKRGQKINLNHCYVAGFSLEEYKEKMNVEKNSNVLINLYGAINSFFDTEESLERTIGRKLNPRKKIYGDKKSITVDFSYVQFGDGNVAFTKARFGDGHIDFSRALFGDGNVNFEKAKFGDGNVSFTQAEFGDGNVSFGHAEFGDGDVHFYNTKFGDGNVFFNYAQFIGNREVDFTATFFGEGIVYFIETQFGNRNVKFCWTRFGDGTVDFNHAKFGDGNVDFTQAQFGSGAVFSNAKFGDGGVKFISANFGGGVYFNQAQFGDGNVDFTKAQFGDRDVYFNQAQFGDGNVNFTKVQFGEGNVDFTKAQFGDGNVDFSHACFGDGNVDFSHARFGDGNVDFSSIDIDRRKGDRLIGATILFNNCYFRNHINMQNVTCYKLTINNCMIEKTLNLERLEVKKLSFKDTKNLGQIFIKWKEDKVAQRLGADSDKDKADQLAILKENFHSIARYDDEDMAYVEFKRYEWKAKNEELKKERIFKRMFHFLKKISFDYISEYGTNYMRVARCMIILFFSFTLFYCTVPGQLLKSDVKYTVSYIPKLNECISYSLATFLTIGYGNITPLTSTSVILSGLEGFLGVFLIAYFTVAFARKVLR